MSNIEASALVNGASGNSDIQSVSRVCRIMQLFSHAPSITTADVVEHLGLNRSTASRYLSSLAGEGFVQRTVQGRFVPGPNLHGVAVALIDSNPVSEAVPYMQRLSAMLNETVVLSLWGGDGPVIAWVEEDDSRLVHVSVRQGSILPPNSAQAQVFLAYLPDRPDVQQLMDGLPDLIRGDLATQIQHVHRHGYAINSHVVQGVRAVAAPTFGRNGLIEATVALVGTVNSIPLNADSTQIQALVETADRISRHRGCSDPEARRKTSHE